MLKNKYMNGKISPIGVYDLVALTLSHTNQPAQLMKMARHENFGLIVLFV